MNLLASGESLEKSPEPLETLCRRVNRLASCLVEDFANTFVGFRLGVDLGEEIDFFANFFLAAGFFAGAAGALGRPAAPLLVGRDWGRFNYFSSASSNSGTIR